jgi:MoxR-like ATPase
LALLAAARAWALLEGRNHVTPDDVQAVLPAVAEHRMDGGQPRGKQAELSTALLASVEGLR